MTTTLGSPTGRAVRLRLRHRLAVAERGADLLQRKLTLLLETRRRLCTAERDADAVWRTKLAEAETWLLRGRVLGGERMLETARSEIGPAETTVDWVTLMGVRYPEHASCFVPRRPTTGFSPGNTALAHAEHSYRGVVQAAADLAAAQTARQQLDHEIRRTRRRARALQRHWIPQLHNALTMCESALDQQELDESARRRIAAR